MSAGRVPAPLAFLPLDERPVNVALPAQIAAIGGAALVMPPADLLPDMRRAGDADALVGWLDAIAADCAGLVVSADMLCYGGLIASRTSADDPHTVLGRTEALRRIKRRHPDLPVAMVSLVMRATNSDNPTEEPEYWADHGKRIHRLGGLHHRAFLHGVCGGNADAPEERRQLAQSLPAEILHDFQRRRLRNHMVNLHTLGMLADGVIDTLLITADDTAEFAAGSVEQLWLRQWRDVLGLDGALKMYPGADEVGAVLVAGQMIRASGKRVAFSVECADPAGLDRIAKFENAPIGQGVAAQLAACGATQVPSAPDVMALVIHTPEPRRRCFVHERIDPDGEGRAAADATAALIASLIAAGRRVALADLRYGNGGDPLLVETLQANGTLHELSAYGGWNTAGNSLGSVVAAAAALQLAGDDGARAAQRLFWHRIIEDYAYQAVVRPPLDGQMRAHFGSRDFPNEDEESRTAARVTGELNAIARRLDAPSWVEVGRLRFPWHRSFEIDFVFPQ